MNCASTHPNNPVFMLRSDKWCSDMVTLVVMVITCAPQFYNNDIFINHIATVKPVLTQAQKGLIEMVISWRKCSTSRIAVKVSFEN